MISKKARLNLREWRANPAKFVWDQFQVEPDKWQEKALSAYASGDESMRRIALSACAGPGKTACLAWIAWNFLSCYGEPGEHPKGAAVSVTWDNLKDNLWAELSKWQQKSEYLSTCFKWTKERLFANDHSETWFLSARSWSKSANSEEQGRVLSGIHSKYVLFLIDESGDIPVPVLKAANQAMTAEFGKIVQAGNPTSHEGMLYAAVVNQADEWFVIKITGDPDDPERSPRIPIEHARKQIELYGRDDPWVKAYILGEFPESSINTLLSLKEVEASLGKHLTPDKYDWAQKRLGVDVARFGMDTTVIFPRQGLAAFKFVEMRGARSHDIAARVMAAKAKWNSEVELVDGTGGFGAGVVDSLIQAGQSPMEIHFSGKAINPKYFNKRSEMWFEMSEWIKRGGALPKDMSLKKELLAPTYSFKNGKLYVEEKDQIKQRLGYSPDRADALALTFAIPDMPKREVMLERAVYQGSELGKLKYEYDPFA